jgi:hypothetical protein
VLGGGQRGHPGTAVGGLEVVEAHGGDRGEDHEGDHEGLLGVGHSLPDYEDHEDHREDHCEDHHKDHHKDHHEEDHNHRSLGQVLMEEVLWVGVGGLLEVLPDTWGAGEGEGAGLAAVVA